MELLLIGNIEECHYKVGIWYTRLARADATIPPSQLLVSHRVLIAMGSSMEKGNVLDIQSSASSSPSPKERRVGPTGLYRNAEEARIFWKMDIHLLSFLWLLYLLSFL